MMLRTAAFGLAFTCNAAVAFAQSAPPPASTPPASAPPPVAPPPAPAATPAPAPPPAPPGVIVTVRADDPNATLERRTGTQSYASLPGLQTGFGQVGTWEAACVAPCKTMVDPKFTYRIAGEGLVPSDSFTVPRDGRALHLDAEMGSSPQRVGGVMLVGAGIGSLLLGGAAMIASPVLEHDQTGSQVFRDSVRDGGYVALGAGVIAAGVGLYLWLSNGTVVRDDASELAKNTRQAPISLSPAGVVF